MDTTPPKTTPFMHAILLRLMAMFEHVAIQTLQRVDTWCARLLIAGLLLPIGVSTAAAATCPDGIRVEPRDAKSGAAIQSALNNLQPEQVLVLSGTYLVHETIMLPAYATVCASERGATLAWSGNGRGLMMDTQGRPGVTIMGLVFDGMGISIKGRGHRIEGNTIRNIETKPGQRKREWAQEMGIFIPDEASDLLIKNNVLTNIVGDTALIGWNVTRARITGNEFRDVGLGIHLFSAQDTLIDDNRGTGVRSTAIELQGDNLPGVVIEKNVFKQWWPLAREHLMGLSIVSGTGTQTRLNTVDCGEACITSQGGWGIEVSGVRPVVESNNVVGFVDVGVAIGPVHEAGVVRGNRIKGATTGISYYNKWKVNESVEISQNQISDAGKTGISGNWQYVRKARIEGNTIMHNAESDQDADTSFTGIQISPTAETPMTVSGNTVQLVGRPKPRLKFQGVLLAGYQGNMQGTQIKNNTIASDVPFGVAFMPNAPGSQTGVIYSGNTLTNLHHATSEGGMWGDARIEPNRCTGLADTSGRMCGAPAR
jgi:nitrous oxidase accessory protein NosD